MPELPGRKCIASPLGNSEPPRVLVFARSNQPFGGIITYLADVLTELVGQRWHVTVAINAAALAARQLQSLDHQVAFLDFPDQLSHGQFVHRVEQALSVVSPDIVHFNYHNSRAITAIPTIRSFKNRQFASLATFHGDIACLGDRPPIKARVKNAPRTLRQRWHVRRFVSAFDRVISVSEAIGRRLPRALWVPKDMIVNIPNGVDIERFRPPDCGRSLVTHEQRGARPRFRLGCSGGLYSYKGFDLAIRAVAKLKDRLDVELLIAGDGPEEKSLRHLAAKMEISDRVMFLGAVTDMPEFIRSIDLILCPSIAVETSCYSQLEAMAGGLPSVCSRYADLAIRVRNGIDGFLVPVGDVSGFASAIEKIIADPSLYASMSRAARDRVVEHYSRADYLAATLGVYRDLLVAHN